MDRRVAEMRPELQQLMTMVGKHLNDCGFSLEEGVEAMAVVMGAFFRALKIKDPNIDVERTATAFLSVMVGAAAGSIPSRMAGTARQ